MGGKNSRYRGGKNPQEMKTSTSQGGKNAYRGGKIRGKS
jgi:hypothetical protein